MLGIWDNRSLGDRPNWASVRSVISIWPKFIPARLRDRARLKNISSPLKAPILSRVRPSLRETFPECLRPGAVPPWCFWRSLAAVFSKGSMARRMASISEGKKSLRKAFSANSPLTTSFKSTRVTGTVPAKFLASGETSFASYKSAIGANDDWVQQSQFFDAGGQGFDIAEIFPVTITDLDFGDW